MRPRSDFRLSDCEFRHKWISEAAYFLSEQRYFASGLELDDWLKAEKDFLAMLILRYQTTAHEDGGITVKGLQRLATMIGVEVSETMNSVEDLIRAIQKVTDGNSCFNTRPDDPCHEIGSCLWKAECKKLIATWLPRNHR